MESQEEAQIDTNLYSRQIGTFGLETMGKLIKMQVAIVGLRGLGVECAKNLILAGPKAVMLYDPEITKINDLGANFYTELAHVGKVSRAEACVGKLRELNPYVKVEVIPDEAALMNLIQSKALHVVCQTEMILNGQVLDPEMVDNTCRLGGCGYISSQTFGPWGYAFVDYGDAHMVTDADGEQTKNFIVVMISKGTETVVTTHEDKRHTYQEGDFVEFREVEGMTELNGTGPYKVIKTTKHTFTLELDSSAFGDYTKQGIVENKKMPKPVQFHAWAESFKNPAGSSQYGMLETPDLAKFGRSEQLHAALFGITLFVKANNRYPEDNETDTKQCVELTQNYVKEIGFEIELE
jgi:ubiquitin-activating enzyme E1